MSIDVREQIRRLEEERTRWLTGHDAKAQSGATPVPIVRSPAPSAVAPAVVAPVPTRADAAAAQLRMIGYGDPRELAELRIACIMDEFTWRCYAQEAGRLITFRPDNYQEVLTDARPHLLFVESAWNGNSGAWQYRVAKYNRPSDDLAKLVAWCRENGIRTVFWNKEDPFHYDRFIDNARLFDCIFTTDANTIPRYREAAGHAQVYVLPFSAQPAFHNPVRLAAPRQQRLCFAGSYYGDRHDARRGAMEELLDAALPFGLDIYDRNHEKNLAIYRFPDRFQPCIKGSLGYDEIERAYKGYRCLLNVNTIQDSPTMFSRRVFEILASGTPVVSNPAKGLTEIFGDDLVQIGATAEEYQRLLTRVMGDDLFYRRLQVRGIRAVMEHHTYRQRLLEVLARIGIALEDPPRQVLVIASPQTPEEVENVIAAFNRQSYVHRQLVLLGGAPLPAVATGGAIRAVVLGENTRRLADLAPEAAMVTCLSPRHWYGRHYLTDLVQALAYSRAAVAGKACCSAVVAGLVVAGDPELEFAFVPSLRADAALFRCEVFRGEPAVAVVEFLSRPGETGALARAGHAVYSSDSLNFLRDATALGSSLTSTVEALDA